MYSVRISLKIGWLESDCHRVLWHLFVGEWGWGVEGSRLEAWMKNHKREVAIT